MTRGPESCILLRFISSTHTHMDKELFTFSRLSTRDAERLLSKETSEPGSRFSSSAPRLISGSYPPVSKERQEYLNSVARQQEAMQQASAIVRRDPFSPRSLAIVANIPGMQHCYGKSDSFYRDRLEEHQKYIAAVAALPAKTSKEKGPTKLDIAAVKSPVELGVFIKNLLNACAATVELNPSIDGSDEKMQQNMMEAGSVETLQKTLADAGIQTFVNFQGSTKLVERSEIQDLGAYLGSELVDRHRTFLPSREPGVPGFGTRLVACFPDLPTEQSKRIESMINTAFDTSVPAIEVNPAATPEEKTAALEAYRIATKNAMDAQRRSITDFLLREKTVPTYPKVYENESLNPALVAIPKALNEYNGWRNSQIVTALRSADAAIVEEQRKALEAAQQSIVATLPTARERLIVEKGQEFGEFLDAAFKPASDKLATALQQNKATDQFLYDLIKEARTPDIGGMLFWQYLSAQRKVENVPFDGITITLEGDSIVCKPTKFKVELTSSDGNTRSFTERSFTIPLTPGVEPTIEMDGTGFIIEGLRIVSGKAEGTYDVSRTSKGRDIQAKLVPQQS